MPKYSTQKFFEEIGGTLIINNVGASFNEASKEEKFSLMLNKYKEILSSTELTSKNESSTPSQVTLIGQQHNNSIDNLKAQDILSKVQNGTVILERDGVIHPQSNSAFAIAESSLDNNNNVVCESTLYTNNPKLSPDIKNLEIGPTYPLSIRERSLFVGMFIARSIAEDPERPITVVFGEEHLEDIQVATNQFLSCMGHKTTPEFAIIPSSAQSYSSTLSQIDGEKEKAKELIEQDEQLPQEMISFFAEFDDEPLLPNQQEIQEELSQPIIHRENFSDFTKKYFSKSEFSDVTSFIRSTAQDYGLERQVIEDKLQDWMSEQDKTSLSAKDTLTQINEIAEEIYRNNNTSHL